MPVSFAKDTGMPVTFTAQKDSSSDEGESFTQAEEAAMQARRGQGSFKRRAMVIRRGPAPPMATTSEEAESANGNTEDTRRMLMDAQATSTYFRGFTEHMPVLCDNLSISPFDAGDTILQEGEEGTWLGVLLKGELGVLQQPEAATLRCPQLQP